MFIVAGAGMGMRCAEGMIERPTRRWQEDAEAVGSHCGQGGRPEGKWGWDYMENIHLEETKGGF